VFLQISKVVVQAKENSKINKLFFLISSFLAAAHELQDANFIPVKVFDPSGHMKFFKRVESKGARQWER
jgi:hypothetical protein